jgi:hypothetical protein
MTLLGNDGRWRTGETARLIEDVVCTRHVEGGTIHCIRIAHVVNQACTNGLDHRGYQGCVVYNAAVAYRLSREFNNSLITSAG